jgi:Rod binding domain-containing protein
MDPVTLSPAIAISPPTELPRDLEGACRALEQEFVTLLFRKMREAMVPKSSNTTAGFARETTQGMLDLQWARLTSQGEGLGLWRALYRELQPQAVKSGPDAADQRGRQGSHGKEAAGDAHDEGSIGTLGPRLGYPQARRAQEAHQGVPGIQPPAESGRFGAGHGE